MQDDRGGPPAENDDKHLACICGVGVVGLCSVWVLDRAASRCRQRSAFDPERSATRLVERLGRPLVGALISRDHFAPMWPCIPLLCPGSGVRPDAITFNAAIAACKNATRWEDALQFLFRMPEAPHGISSGRCGRDERGRYGKSPLEHMLSLDRSGGPRKLTEQSHLASLRASRWAVLPRAWASNFEPVNGPIHSRSTKARG